VVGAEVAGTAETEAEGEGEAGLSSETPVEAAAGGVEVAEEFVDEFVVSNE
jgi:hypothetical protein